MTDEFIKNVKFSGNQKVRDEMVALVDDMLKAGADIKADIDLSQGLSILSDTCRIKIIDEDDSLSIRIEPGEGSGDSIRFGIHKKTRTVYQADDDVVEEEEVPIDEDMDFLDDI